MAGDKVSQRSESESGGLGQRVFRNSIWNTAGFIAATFLAFFLLPIIIRHLGISQYGLYGLIMALVAPMSLANLGFGQATIKYVAEYVDRGELEIASRYLRTTLSMSLVVGIVGFCILTFAGPPIATALFNLENTGVSDLRWCFFIAAIGWIVNQATSVFSGVPSAFQKYRYVAIGNTLYPATSSLLGLFFVLIGTGLIGYIFATVFSALILLCYWIAVSKRLMPKHSIWPGFDIQTWKQCFQFGGWQTLAQVGGLVATQSERYLLGAFLSPSAVGIYNVTFRLEQTAYTAVFKLAEVLFPAFSALSNESIERRAVLLMRSSWLLTSLAVCALIPLVPLAHSFLDLWMGPNIAEPGTPVLQALAVGGTLGCATNASYFYLLGTGKTKWISAIALVTGAVSIMVAWIVLPRFGMKAAGWSGIAAMVAQIVILNIMLKRVFGETLQWKRIWTFLFVPIGIGLFAACLITSTLTVHCPTWFHLVAWYASVSVAIACAIWLSNFLLPFGNERNSDILKIIHEILRRIPISN